MIEEMEIHRRKEHPDAHPRKEESPEAWKNAEKPFSSKVGFGYMPSNRRAEDSVCHSPGTLQNKR
jgi:hypothetical protein